MWLSIMMAVAVGVVINIVSTIVIAKYFSNNNKKETE